MKISKMKAAATAAATLAFSAAQAAEVEVWGVVDTSLKIADNGDETVSRLSSGNREASRFGFRGSEKLSDGFEAFFRLEATAFVDDGRTSNAPNRLLEREAVLGIRSEQYGTLSFGRLYTLHFLTMTMSDPSAMSIGSACGYYHETSINGGGSASAVLTWTGATIPGWPTPA